MAERAARLGEDLAGIPLPDIAASVDRELRIRAERFVTGLENYRHHAYRRSVREPAPVWRRGSTRLLDYGPPDGRPLLVIPSLVNRAYILDLIPEHSMLRGLAAAGLRPLLVDWDMPGETERGFDLTGYVCERLEPMLAAAAALTGQTPIVLGYCMGGLLALALATRAGDTIPGLVLIATPWDFTRMTGYGPLLGALAGPLDQMFGPLGEIPAEIIHMLFAIADPLLAVRKFSRFAALDPASVIARRFVATEDWLNDGVPLPLRVAGECLGGWYGENTPGRGLWRIAGAPVRPGEFDGPVLLVQPARDRLVPPASMAPFATTMPRADWLRPDLGHVGIAASAAAPEAVWQPLAAWARGLPSG